MKGYEEKMKTKRMDKIRKLGQALVAYGQAVVMYGQALADHQKATSSAFSALAIHQHTLDDEASARADYEAEHEKVNEAYRAYKAASAAEQAAGKIYRRLRAGL